MPKDLREGAYHGKPWKVVVLEGRGTTEVSVVHHTHKMKDSWGWASETKIIVEGSSDLRKERVANSMAYGLNSTNETAE